MRNIDAIITRSLKEDAAENDITSQLLIPENALSKAHILFKEQAIVCGISVARKVFSKLQRNIHLTTHVKDGENVKKGTKILTIEGKTRAILAAERTALNFLSHLSGIATLTGKYVNEVRPYKAKICDTRKTTPGLRTLEKYAVICGKGTNHRRDLQDFLLIKDNHIAANTQFKSLAELIKTLRKKTKKTIELEVDNLDQFQEALAEPPDIILLDNMNKNQLQKAVKMLKAIKWKKPFLEASGGITLKNVREFAQTGVDRISIGAITHSAKSINVSLEIISS